MPDLASSPVSVGIFTTLNVSSLKAATPTGAGCLGGVKDNVPQNPTWPFLWYELFAETDRSGLGDGLSTVEIELRLHVFSQFAGTAEEQRIMAEAIRLLKFSEPTVTGWTVPKIGRPVTPGVAFPDELLNGVRCREYVSVWTLFADETA